MDFNGLNRFFIGLIRHIGLIRRQNLLTRRPVDLLACDVVIPT